MFAENKENAKYNLQGRILKSFSVLFFSFLSFILFVSSSFLCLHFLIFDTSFLGQLDVFKNQYIHVAICAFSVIENLFLLMFHIYIKLKKDMYFYFVDIDTKISVMTVFKAFNIYALKFMKRIMSLIYFTFPFISFLIVIINMLQQGMSFLVFLVFSVGDLIFFIVGLYSFAVYIQKYQLLTFVLMQNQGNNIRECFSLSAKLMNGKCKYLLKLKIINLPKKLLCLFVFPAFYYLPLCNAVEADYVFQKEKPYMRRNAYTEKPIVFYFNPIKEN